jgi:hypothetical protein
LKPLPQGPLSWSNQKRKPKLENQQKIMLKYYIHGNAFHIISYDFSELVIALIDFDKVEILPFVNV